MCLVMLERLTGHEHGMTDDLALDSRPRRCLLIRSTSLSSTLYLNYNKSRVTHVITINPGIPSDLG